MFFHILRSFIAVCAGVYIIYVGYGLWFKRAKKKREIFPDDEDFYKSDRMFHLIPNSVDLDERYTEFREYVERQNKEVWIKVSLALALIFTLNYFHH